MATMEDLEARVVELEAQMKMMERLVGAALAGRSDFIVASAPGAGPGAEEHEPRLLSQLTTKQHVALQMLMAGRSNADIAERFGVTENGAKVYLRAIYKKFGVHTRSQAVMAVYDEWEKVSDRQYLTLSRGVPKTWAQEFLPKPVSEDPYRGMYQMREAADAI